MTDLCTIAKQSGTDKGPEHHQYTQYYDFYFNKLRNQSNQLLEIGIYRGTSLTMWKKYFDNDTKIVGTDILPECKNYENQEDNVFVEIGDQTDKEFLQGVSKLHGPFNIIIDDGGHSWKQQIVSFETLFPELKPGGIYVIEDLHTSYWRDGKNFLKQNGIKDKFPDLDLTYGDYDICTTDYLKNLVDKVMISGKSFTRYQELNGTKLDYFENNIEFIHFYKSMCFIKKKETPIQ